jgi:AsmA protein
MKRILRYVLILLGIVIVVLIALPFFISVNTFRPTVEQKLSAALGRQVQVGNLSLSLFSGSLSAASLAIADDPAFSKGPFLTAKAFKVGVEMWPLITSKTLNVTGLTIEKPEVNLIRNAAGQWNFSSLATGSKSSDTKTESGATPDFSVRKLNLNDGRLTVGSTTSNKKSVYEEVNLEASDVSLKSKFPAKVTAKLPGGGDFKLEGNIGPVDPEDASLTPLDAKVNINGLDLAKTGFVEPNSGLGGTVNLSNTLVSQSGMAHAQGSVLAKSLQLVKGGSPSGVPVNVDFNVDYDLRKSSGLVKQGVIKIGQAVSRLSGTFASKGDSTVVNMNIAGQNLPVQDLQEALPAFGVVLPKGSSLRAGTLNLDVNAQGPVDKLVTSGKVGLFNAQLAGFDLGSKLAVISKLTGMKSSGSDTSIQKLTSDVRVAPDGIQSNNLDMVVPAIGQLTGGGTVSPSNALNFKMTASLAGAKIPFSIQGTASDPKFIPDVGGMVGGLVQSKIGSALGNNPQTKGLGDALGNLFGSKKKKQ